MRSIIKEYFRPDHLSPPVPVLALVGESDYQAGVADFLLNQLYAGNAQNPLVSLKSAPDSHGDQHFLQSAFGGQAKGEAVPAPRGIMKAEWFSKHRSKRAAAVLVLINRNELLGDFSSYNALLQRLREVQDVALSRGAGMLVAVLQTFEEGELPADCVASLCQRLNIHAKLVCGLPVCLIGTNELSRSAEAVAALKTLGQLAHELCSAYYLRRVQHVTAKLARRSVAADADTYLQLNARAATKLAAYAEFRRDWRGAVSQYQTAYSHARAILKASSGGSGGGQMSHSPSNVSTLSGCSSFSGLSSLVPSRQNSISNVAVHGGLGSMAGRPSYTGVPGSEHAAPPGARPQPQPVGNAQRPFTAGSTQQPHSVVGAGDAGVSMVASSMAASTLFPPGAPLGAPPSHTQQGATTKNQLLPAVTALAPPAVDAPVPAKSSGLPSIGSSPFAPVPTAPTTAAGLQKPLAPGALHLTASNLAAATSPLQRTLASGVPQLTPSTAITAMSAGVHRPLPTGTAAVPTTAPTALPTPPAPSAAPPTSASQLLAPTAPLPLPPPPQQQQLQSMLTPPQQQQPNRPFTASAMGPGSVPATHAAQAHIPQGLPSQGLAASANVLHANPTHMQHVQPPLAAHTSAPLPPSSQTHTQHVLPPNTTRSRPQPNTAPPNPLMPPIPPPPGAPTPPAPSPPLPTPSPAAHNSHQPQPQATQPPFQHLSQAGPSAPILSNPGPPPMAQTPPSQAQNPVPPFQQQAQPAPPMRQQFIPNHQQPVLSHPQQLPFSQPPPITSPSPLTQGHALLPSNPPPPPTSFALASRPAPFSNSAQPHMTHPLQSTSHQGPIIHKASPVAPPTASLTQPQPPVGPLLSSTSLSSSSYLQPSQHPPSQQQYPLMPPPTFQQSQLQHPFLPQPTFQPSQSQLQQQLFFQPAHQHPTPSQSTYKQPAHTQPSLTPQAPPARPAYTQASTPMQQAGLPPATRLSTPGATPQLPAAPPTTSPASAQLPAPPTPGTPASSLPAPFLSAIGSAVATPQTPPAPSEAAATSPQEASPPGGAAHTISALSPQIYLQSARLAELLHLKLVMLLTVQERLEEAAAQSSIHLGMFASEPGALGPAVASVQLAFLARQLQVVAEVVSPKLEALSTWSSTAKAYSRSMLLLSAAQVAATHRRAAEGLDVGVSTSFDLTAVRSGQCLGQAVLQEQGGATRSLTDAEFVAWLVAVEHGSVVKAPAKGAPSRVVNLQPVASVVLGGSGADSTCAVFDALAAAAAVLKTREPRAPRERALLCLLTGEELLALGNHKLAHTHLLAAAHTYRREGWPDLLLHTLLLLVEIATQLNLTKEAALHTLEAATLQPALLPTGSPSTPTASSKTSAAGAVTAALAAGAANCQAAVNDLLSPADAAPSGLSATVEWFDLGAVGWLSLPVLQGTTQQQLQLNTTAPGHLLAASSTASGAADGAAGQPVCATGVVSAEVAAAIAAHHQQDFGWWRVLALSVGWAAHTPPDTSAADLYIALRSTLPPGAPTLPISGATFTLRDEDGEWSMPACTVLPFQHNKQQASQQQQQQQQQRSIVEGQEQTHQGGVVWSEASALQPSGPWLHMTASVPPRRVGRLEVTHMSLRIGAPSHTHPITVTFNLASFPCLPPSPSASLNTYSTLGGLLERLATTSSTPQAAHTAVSQSLPGVPQIGLPGVDSKPLSPLTRLSAAGGEPLSSRGAAAAKAGSVGTQLLASKGLSFPRQVPAPFKGLPPVDVKGGGGGGAALMISHVGRLPVLKLVPTSHERTPSYCFVGEPCSVCATLELAPSSQGLSTGVLECAVKPLTPGMLPNDVTIIVRDKEGKLVACSGSETARAHLPALPAGSHHKLPLWVVCRVAGKVALGAALQCPAVVADVCEWEVQPPLQLSTSLHSEPGTHVLLITLPSAKALRLSAAPPSAAPFTSTPATTAAVTSTSTAAHATGLVAVGQQLLLRCCLQCFMGAGDGVGGLLELLDVQVLPDPTICTSMPPSCPFNLLLPHLPDDAKVAPAPNAPSPNSMPVNATTSTQPSAVPLPSVGLEVGPGDALTLLVALSCQKPSPLVPVSGAQSISLHQSPPTTNHLSPLQWPISTCAAVQAPSLSSQPTPAANQVPPPPPAQSPPTANWALSTPGFETASSNDPGLLSSVHSGSPPGSTSSPQVAPHTQPGMLNNVLHPSTQPGPSLASSQVAAQWPDNTHAGSLQTPLHEQGSEGGVGVGGSDSNVPVSGVCAWQPAPLGRLQVTWRRWGAGRRLSTGAVGVIDGGQQSAMEGVGLRGEEPSTQVTSLFDLPSVAVCESAVSVRILAPAQATAGIPFTLTLQAQSSSPRAEQLTARLLDAPGFVLTGEQAVQQLSLPPYLPHPVSQDHRHGAQGVAHGQGVVHGSPEQLYCTWLLVGHTAGHMALPCIQLQVHHAEGRGGATANLTAQSPTVQVAPF